MFFFLGLALIGSGHEPSAQIAECSDGIDNDGDGDTDINDLECYAFVAFAQNPGESDEYRYCPNWDDESTIPTLAQCQ